MNTNDTFQPWDIVECSHDRDEDGYQYAVAVNATTGERQVFNSPDAIDHAMSFVHYGNETPQERYERTRPYGLDWQEEQNERLGRG